MTRTNTERLAAIMRPIAEAVHPPEAMRRARRVNAALDEEGRATDFALETMVTAAPLLANSLVIESGAQSSADTGSTSSTSAYSTAIDTQVYLPDGVWTIKATGGLSLNHSAGTNARMYVEIDGGDASSTVLEACPSTGTRMVIDAGSVTGIEGGRTISIKVKYRSSSAGTTTASNPWVQIVAMRTA